MARIFLILAVLGGIASAVFGYLNVDKGHIWRSQDEAHVATLTKTTNTLNDTTKTLEATKATLAQTKQNLDDTTTKADALQSDLTKAQAKSTDLEQKVADAMQKITAAQTEAEDLKSKLGEQSDAAQKAQAKVAQLESDLRIRTDDLQASNAEVDRLKKLKEDSLTGHMNPGITGQIVSINTNWNFVVLNIGEKQGVVSNGEFMVSHGKDYIGKVRVANTEANTCVADVLLDSLKGTLQVGDNVTN